MQLFTPLTSFRLSTTARRLIPSTLAITALLISFAACSLPPRVNTTPAATPPTPSATTTPLPAFTLTINNPHNLISSTLVSELRTQFTSTYPKLYQRFGNANTATSVTLTVYTSNDGSVASTVAAQAAISVNAVYQNENPTDTGWLTHELTHVVQNYVGDNLPGWFIEGMADYSRYYYAPTGTNPNWWSIPGPPAASDNYTAGYGTTARYLIWLQEHKSSSIVNQLNHTLQTKPDTFATVFQQLTGGTPDQVWAQYVANSTIVQKGDCQGGFQVSYSMTQAASSFTASVTIKNSGNTKVDNWALAFTFPNTQRITEISNATFSQLAEAILIQNTSSNGSLTPGSSVHFTFTASWDGTNDYPVESSYKLNNKTCNLMYT